MEGTLSAVPVQLLQATGLLGVIPRPGSTRYTRPIRSRTNWVCGGICTASPTPWSAAVNQGTGERIADLFKLLPQHRVPQLTNPILREARASINTWGGGGDRPWSRGCAAPGRGSSRPVGDRGRRSRNLGRTRGFKPPRSIGTPHPLYTTAQPTPSPSTCHLQKTITSLFESGPLGGLKNSRYQAAMNLKLPRGFPKTPHTLTIGSKNHDSRRLCWCPL